MDDVTCGALHHDFGGKGLLAAVVARTEGERTLRAWDAAAAIRNGRETLLVGGIVRITMALDAEVGALFCLVVRFLPETRRAGRVIPKATRQSWSKMPGRDEVKPANAGATAWLLIVAAQQPLAEASFRFLHCR